MNRLDELKFESAGASGCSNSDYVLCRTTCCAALCVEDVELTQLYVAPDDLSKLVALWGDVDRCPICGAAEWDVLPTADDDVVAGSWARFT
jgi:hypothetical protein